jgi:nitrogen regulatory protein PII
MKEISVFYRLDDLTQVTEILRKHNAISITFEINGYGRSKLGAIQETVEAAYTTRRSILTKDESIVPDWTFIRFQTRLEDFAN